MTTLIFVLSMCTLAQRPGGFHVVGPGGGGAMFHPTVSPHNPSTVVVACDMTGSYISHDGGQSWRMFNLRGPVRFFLFDPILPNVIYAQNNILWRSRDNGKTWAVVVPSRTGIQGISMASDHSDEEIVSDSNPLGSITALAIDPADSNHLYASAGGVVPGLFESTDAGSHWARTAPLPELALRMWVSAGPSQTLIAIGKSYILRKTRAKIDTFRVPFTVLDASAGRTSNGSWTLYAASAAAISISADAGMTWTRTSLPGGGAQIRAIATSFNHPETAYVSYSGLRLNGAVWHGVARTQDFGKAWQLVWKESTAAAANVHDAWITERFGTGWGENPLNLTVADQDPRLVYATDFGRTLVSTDGGRNWNAAYSRRTVDGAWTTTGLDVTTAYGIHFDPFNLDRQFITFTDVSLFRSETGGRSWRSSSAGVPKSWLNTTYWMTFDPKVRGRAWSVNSGTHDLPRPKMFRHTSTGTYRGGVCRSDDGGLTWTASSTGMPQTAPTDILLDLASPQDSRTLYVAAFGRGVYKSTDDGRTWSAQNNGIFESSPLAWRLTLASNQALYLVIARRSEDGSIGNSGDGALYRSTDGAKTWHSVPLPTGVNGPSGLAVDPTDPQHLYLSAWARAVGRHGEGGGVFQSSDGGQHWTSSLIADQHVYDVTVDARLPGTVYASGFESSAWVSRDSGRHWGRISGFNFKWGHRVVLDPTDAKSVYITTFGGGVWHGSVTTAPAVLDIATPELEPHL